MPAVRSSMRKIKDVLRLKYEANLSCRQIASSLKLSVGVISKYTKAAEEAGLPGWAGAAAGAMAPIAFAKTAQGLMPIFESPVGMGAVKAAAAYEKEK